MSKIFKTLVDVTDGHRLQPLPLDTILWRDLLWLVGGWQLTKNGQNRRPTRLVRPDLFDFRQSNSAQDGVDYTLSVAVPKAILDGRGASGSAVTFQSVEAPEVEFPA
jgi:hypothetical protein